MIKKVRCIDAIGTNGLKLGQIYDLVDISQYGNGPEYFRVNSRASSEWLGSRFEDVDPVEVAPEEIKSVKEVKMKRKYEFSRLEIIRELRVLAEKMAESSIISHDIPLRDQTDQLENLSEEISRVANKLVQMN